MMTNDKALRWCKDHLAQVTFGATGCSVRIWATARCETSFITTGSTLSAAVRKHQKRLEGNS